MLGTVIQCFPCIISQQSSQQFYEVGADISAILAGMEVNWNEMALGQVASQLRDDIQTST